MVFKEKNYIDNKYYAPNNRLFKIVGLCQYQTSVKELIHTCSINIIITIALFCQICMLFTTERKINIITKSLETTLPTLCFGSCYYNLLYHATIMKQIQHRIKCDWDELKNKPELVILKKYGNVSRLCTIIITISFYLYVIFLICPSQWYIIQFNLGMINETELTLPINYAYFMKNQFYYYFGNFSICICIIIISMVGAANYSMFIAVIQHACALFDIVVWRVNERFKPRLYYSNRSCSSVEENEWIIGIIKFYNNAIDFVNLVKLCYETVILFEGLFALIFIMVDYFYMFQILSSTLSTSERLIKFFYVFGSLLVIYAYSFIGQKLINHHTDLFINLCQIPFYSLSFNTQKMYLFLMGNNTRTCHLSIGGVFLVSHSIFAKIMRLSFSFTTVFYNLGER